MAERGIGGLPERKSPIAARILAAVAEIRNPDGMCRLCFSLADERHVSDCPANLIVQALQFDSPSLIAARPYDALAPARRGAGGGDDDA